MTASWLKALFLVCVFGAVMLGVEALISWAAANRSEGRAINLRLRLLQQGHSRAETRTLLRRGTGDFAASLPPRFGAMANRLERLLIASQLDITPARVMLILGVVPTILFLLILLLMVGKGIVFSPGRLLLVATIAGLVGGVIPLMFLQAKANRVRRKMQDQFPVALDVFVRGLRAGHPVASALDLLTVEMADPIGSEFGLSSTRSPMAPTCATRLGRWPTDGGWRTCGCSSSRCRCRARPVATSPRSSRICRKSFVNARR